MPFGQEISSSTSVLPSRTSLPALEEADWRQQLARAVREPAELLHRLELHAEQLGGWPLSGGSFSLLAPESYVARMRVGDPRDPLLRQVWPGAEEALARPGFVLDPVQDATFREHPGLLQKYHGRALLIVTGRCAVHCRYCFRRHYPYEDEPRSLSNWGPALQAIADDATLHEVILSGGDPLVLSDRRLGELLTSLESIAHVRRVRLHTRLPIVLPARITDQLLDRFQKSRLQTIWVVHANHAQELQADCAAALGRLRQAGFPLLNQAVLLRGVNDTEQALLELCERSVDLGVLPYYLHQLDRVQGAAHFEVSVLRGQELMRSLRGRLPGYAVPRYVQEIAGEDSKTPLVETAR